MSLRAQVLEQYGVRLGEVPEDGRMRSFRIDPFRIGFLISLGGCGAFGCFADGEAWTVSRTRPEHGGGVNVEKIRLTPRELRGQAAESMRFERLIIDIARAQLDSGRELSSEDLARLERAVMHVEVSA